jgi:ubiquinone/menaquinone biosynthesis C-methylase UbiE
VWNWREYIRTITVANDLLEDRLSVARERLPSGVTFLEGDARNLDFKDTSFDIVIQSTVFSSILDNSVQEDLAQKMWQWVMPGGCVLWYDFIYNNPKNPDVRGVPIKRIRELFPGGDIFVKKVTLAPPIARFITSITPNLYSFFNLFPILRTHVLCWIKKQ